MSYQACIDIGGTFTDCLVADQHGAISIHKSPTTPGRFEDGFMEVLHIAAKQFNQSLEQFVAEIDQIVHGSTISTNALVERKVAKTGLILNKGHKDILTLREGPRKGAFEWKLDYPEPYIPAWLTFTVGGRIDARGYEHVPLDEDAVVEAVGALRRRGVEAIAVGLLWSIVNAAHELRVKEIIAREWPCVPVTLSHKINPLPREYKRIISAAIDASISPIVSKYIEKLVAKLNESGFRGDLLMANCVGGMMPTQDMIQRPIYSVMSGPTLAPIAALALTDEPDVIVGDMGGTTFDVSALRDHQLIVTPDSMIHDDALGIPKVDVRSVGAGGGSTAWVDDGGLLHVGPQSAGAVPGPACFGKGGDRPTVTDANVVLGLIDPDYFLGGNFPLRKDLAEKAVARIAKALDVDLMQAAYAISTTSNHNMVGAIEDITIREGLNPRDCYFVCGGGGTALHIAEMADILGLKRYMIPRFMAGLSAFGGLISEIRWETSRSLHTDHHRFRFDDVGVLLQVLRGEADEFLAGARVPPDLRGFEYAFLGRYEYQSWEIEVPFKAVSGDITEDIVAGFAESFHRAHERIYGIRNDGDRVEFTRWRVRAIGQRKHQNIGKNFTLERQTVAPKPKSYRSVYIHDGSTGALQPLPVFEKSTLYAGAMVKAPALVEADTYTAFLRPGHHAKVDAQGNLMVEVS